MAKFIENPFVKPKGFDSLPKDEQQRLMDEHAAQEAIRRAEFEKASNPPSNAPISFRGKFSLEKESTGARYVAFSFEHDNVVHSARMAATFPHAELVRQQLRKSASVECDCYLALPEGERKNVQLYRITDDSLTFDFDLTNVQIQELEAEATTVASARDAAKVGLSEVKAAKRERQLAWR